MANTTRRRRVSEAERAARRRRGRERLQQAAGELLTSEGWRRWVQVRSRGRPGAAVAVQPAAGRACAGGRDIRRGIQELAPARVLR
jgi:hypothetical protein